MMIVALAVFGLIFGSFVNAAVWRLRQQDLLAGKGKKASSKFSLARGRSMCSTCNHPLKSSDLVPVFSWLSLGGKCRYCKNPIKDTPLPELLLASLFALSYIAWPWPLREVHVAVFGLWLAFLVTVVALAVYDWYFMELPTKLIRIAFVLSVLMAALIGATTGDWLSFGYGLLTGLLFGGFFYLLFTITDGRGIGGGDVRLAVPLGIVLGSIGALGLAIFMASLLGVIVSIPALLSAKNRLKLKIPFGPYLIMATIFTVLYGDRILAAYLGLFV